MSKKKYYLTLDTETATLPFVNQMTKDSKDKQKLAIAKPLVYDIGWVVTDRQHNEIKRENFLVQETFFVPNVFNTAYYKDKRPKYMEMFQKGEIIAKSWNNIIEILLEDLRECNLAVAYNATFDFKKAIPFTERYIHALYSNRYNEWEENQRTSCEKILNNVSGGKNDTFMESIFVLRNEEFPIADLWGLSCEKLLNNQRYKEFCLKNRLISPSGIYFKTSAETSYQYLTKDESFIESHTALDDAIIESYILAKLLKKGKVEPTLKAFPFRVLGETHSFCDVKPKYKEVVIEFMQIYIDGVKSPTRYSQRIKGIISRLEGEKEK